jgi:hypothetical protein
MKPPRAGVAQAKRPSPPQPKPPAAAPRPVLQPKPFKPRRKLFAVLMIAFAVWVAALVVMYFATVYPSREGAPPAPSPSGRELG